MTKSCKDCNKRRLLKFFYGSGKGHLSSYCKDCHCKRAQQQRKVTKARRSTNQRDWRNNNPDAHALIRSRKNAKRGGYAPLSISVEDLIAKRLAHDKFCDIEDCERFWQVRDHDHSVRVNNLRGFLCKRHNTALGSFGDSLEGIMKVVKYLKRVTC